MTATGVRVDMTDSRRVECLPRQSLTTVDEVKDVDAATRAMADELNRIRLDDDRSYASLAADIGIDPGALYRLLNEDEREPWDRTLHKIRRYLDGRRAPRRRAS